MSARRLLVVTDEMEVGGSQRQISYLLDALDRRYWQPELLYFRNESFLVDQLRAQGVVVHRIAKRGRLDPAFVLRYAKLLRSRRYHLVHAFSLTAELWTTVASALVRRPPAFVSSVRGLYLDKPDWFWRIKRMILARSAAIIANAEAGAAAAAERSGVSRSRIDVVPNGTLPVASLPPDQRNAIRRSLGVPDGRLFGLFVGRLVKEKNLPCLMRALAALPPATRPWIALAGDGPMRKEIEDMRVLSCLEGDVRFLGERDDTVSLMQAADLMILPSSLEGMSNVLMEAMSACCPVVASDVGGNPELVRDGETGLIFPNDDSDALAGQLGRLMNDDVLRKTLADRALQRMREDYSIARMVSSTEAVYARCLHGAPGVDFTDRTAIDSDGAGNRA